MWGARAQQGRGILLRSLHTRRSQGHSGGQGGLEGILSARKHALSLSSHLAR